MNYIKHLNRVMAEFAADDRLTTHHISLYFVLFRIANEQRFVNPFQIVRLEVMQEAKIGSVGTYIRCLKELGEWGYVGCKTSHNPTVGTWIHLYDFGNTPCTSERTTPCTTLPYIDNINTTKVEKGETPTLDEVVMYFSEQKFPWKEAQKFFHHYQSKGWLVGGKSPMRDWRAAAQNWMLNTDQFKAHDKGPKLGPVQGGGTKDYSEPL